MKVLLLNGSPRGEGSGTLKLARAFLEGLQDACGAEVETVHLIEKKILPCRGCFGCWTGTPGRCVQRDDMDELLPRYRQAELVVWCLPLYYFGMPSHAKALSRWLRPMAAKANTHTCDHTRRPPRRIHSLSVNTLPKETATPRTVRYT